MAERLFTNTTGAYGYDPEVDNTYPHTFGEFTVGEEEAVTAGHVVKFVGPAGEIGTATGQTANTGTFGIALDTVAWEAGRPKIAKVVTAGFCTAVAGDTVTAGSPVVSDADGKVLDIGGYSAGDFYVGFAVTSGDTGDTVVIRVDPTMLQVGD